MFFHFTFHDPCNDVFRLAKTRGLFGEDLLLFREVILINVFPGEVKRIKCGEKINGLLETKEKEILEI